MPPPRRRRTQPGQPTGEGKAEEAAEEMTSPAEEQLPDEREEWFRSPGFSRQKTTWSADEREQMDRVQGSIERVFTDAFSDVLAMMNDLYDLVREVEVDEETGEMLLDAHGFTVWKRNPATGAYIEDWSTLTARQKEHFLFQITANVFEWEQRAARFWTEAMYSKALFTERFAVAYDKPVTGTIEDRTAAANSKSAEDRYFALMLASISRRADSLVRTMNTLALRLKDTL